MSSLLHNVRLNFFAFLMGKAAAACVGLLLPRLLGLEKMGYYTAAWGMAALVSVLSDLGLASYLTRQVSQNRSAVSALFFRALLVQLLQISLAATLLAVAMALKWTGGLDGALIALAFIGMALASLTNPFSASLQGLEQYKAVSMVATATSLLNAASLGMALWLWPEPAMAFAALALSGIVGVALWALVFVRLGLVDAPPRSWRLAEFFRGALPFAMVSTVNTIYVRVDLAILTWMLGPAALGHYGAAVKMVDLSVPLLGALAGPLYPRLSGNFSAASLNRALRYLGAVCLPLGVGGTVLAGPLMIWFFGMDFSEAGLAFRWMAWVPALIGIHGALLHAMNALGKTKLIALIFLANLLLNVGLNLLLIPRFGFEAAAALSTLCEAVVLLASISILIRSGIAIQLRRWLWPALPAALLMGAAMLLLPKAQGWLVPAYVLAGAAFYASLLWIFGFMGDEERLHLRRLLGREA